MEPGTCHSVDLRLVWVGPRRTLFRFLAFFFCQQPPAYCRFTNRIRQVKDVSGLAWIRQRYMCIRLRLGTFNLFASLFYFISYCLASSQESRAHFENDKSGDPKRCNMPCGTITPYTPHLLGCTQLPVPTYFAPFVIAHNA